jgi:hypothetical protein
VAFVAVRRHIRVQASALTLLTLVALPACSRGSGASSKGNGACALIAKLDDTAATVARADVSDPAAFKKTLDVAVAQYLATLHALRLRVPADAQRSVDRVIADVQQLRFDDARTDRADLNDFATRECGRTTATTAP